MSIFFPDKCEVCEQETTHQQKRCDYCRPRFDPRKQPYIIYCDIYHFERKRRIKTSMNVWAMDDHVVKTEPAYSMYYGKPILEVIDDLINQGFTLKFKSDAVYKSVKNTN